MGEQTELREGGGEGEPPWGWMGPARHLPLDGERKRSISNGVSKDVDVMFVRADAHPRLDSRGNLIFPSLGFVGQCWDTLGSTR